MADIPKKLKTYRTRRNLAESPEPYGGKKKQSKKPIFVVQKHAASHLHYDFRLEIDGVLVSWAIPKGPCLNPSIKRFAARTDDHPMEYANFEGVIPKGNYGGGTVMVWDRGTFKNLKTKNGKEVPLSRCVKEGRVEVWLDGEKLKGGFAVIKFIGRSNKEDWLFIKMRDEYARRRTSWSTRDEKSVKSGRTMRQIGQEESDEEE